MNGSKLQCRFVGAWAFPADVQPLFPVPSCVLFAEGSDLPATLPSKVLYFSGHLPRRDANRREADEALTELREAWPDSDKSFGGSPYRMRFRNGAVLWPRRLVLVERVPSGRLGENPAAPLVEGRVTNLDKRPWKDIEPLKGPVEAEFLRSVYLGESVAPFRILAPILGVIPIEASSAEVLDSDQATARGFSELARWLQTAESLWNRHSKQARSFTEQINFFENLSSQFPLRALRVVYAKAGMNPAAAILRDEDSVVENGLYWLATDRLDEALFLTAVLNSETTRERAAHYQAMGQWGARHFDKVMFNLPIPRFDPKAKLHRQLSAAAERAEKLAAAVPLNEGKHFIQARKRIREALHADGIADEIDALVERLLSAKSQQIAA